MNTTSLFNLGRALSEADALLHGIECRIASTRDQLDDAMTRIREAQDAIAQERKEEMKWDHRNDYNHERDDSEARSFDRSEANWINSGAI